MYVYIYISCTSKSKDRDMRFARDLNEKSLSLYNMRCVSVYTSMWFHLIRDTIVMIFHFVNLFYNYFTIIFRGKSNSRKLPERDHLDRAKGRKEATLPM